MNSVKSVVAGLGLLLISQAASADFTTKLSPLHGDMKSVLGWSQPDFCTLHIAQLEGQDIPSFVDPGPLFRVEIRCDGTNVVSTDLIRDPSFPTPERIYTDLLSEFTKRNLELKLNKAEAGGMTYLFVRK